MPKRNRTSSASWLFRDHTVIVQDGHSEHAWAYFPLFVKFDQSHSRALISIRLMAQLEGFDQAQSISLLAHPDDIVSCEIYTPEELAPRIRNQLILDEAIASDSDVLILSISLNSPGRVIAPVGNSPMSSKPAFRYRFAPFYSLCQSNHLRFYFTKDQLDNDRARQLRELVDLAQAGKLEPFPTDLQRLGGGKGVQEASWQIFHVPEAPPSYTVGTSTKDSAQSASNKRPRAASSPTPDVPPAKKHDREATPTSFHYPSQATTADDDDDGHEKPSPQPQTRPSQATTVPDDETAASSQQRQNDDDDAPTAPPSSSCSSPRPADALSTSSPSPPPYRRHDGDGPANVATGPPTPSAAKPAAKRPRAPIHTSTSALRALLRAELPAALRATLPAILRETVPHILLPLLSPDQQRLEDLVAAKLPAEVDLQIADLLDDAVEGAVGRVEEAVEDAVGEVRDVGEECAREVAEAGREAVEGVVEEVEGRVGDVLGNAEERVGVLEGRVGRLGGRARRASV